MNRLIFVNPQWQGGGDMETYHGARELADYYLYDTDYTELEVYQTLNASDCADSSAGCDKDISAESEKFTGQSAIVHQTKKAMEQLRHAKRGKILTIGGGCDADLPSIYYLHQHFDGEIAVLWMDAHGDINAPSESGSGLFYGMPVRALLGESEGVFDDIIEKPMSPNQFINLGGRVLDQSERRFFEKHNIPVISVYDNKNLLDDITRAVEATGKRRLYIHLDLDVTEPSPLISTPVPEPDGLAAEDLLPLLQELDRRFHLTGLGIFEYKPCGKKSEILDSIIDFGLNF